MTINDRIDEFPREAYLKLLHGAQRLFSTEQDRRNLLAGFGLASAAAERQTKAAVLPVPLSATGDEGSTLPAPVTQVLSRDERLSSPASFAMELVELVARPSSLDAAVTLARRALVEIGLDEAGNWDGLLQQLVALQRKYRVAAAPVPDVAGYREWLGFDCRHPYSLTDRFIGREEFLKELDDWVTSETDVGVRCLWALGGGGKSALAWHWLSKSLPLIRSLKYEGAFWCSFYEKSFGFEELLRRALAFCGRLTEADVQRMPRGIVEERLLDLMEKRRLVVVLDGLERLMNGYAIVADRAVDHESLKGTIVSSALTRTDRRMGDPRDGAFIRKLARVQATRLLITSRLAPADLESNATSSALPYVNFTELTGFREKDAIELWTSIVPHASVSKALRRVFQDCGYHPLVISVLARSVARCKGGWDEWLRLEAHQDFNPREAITEVAVRTHIVGVCLRDLAEPTYQLLGTLTTTGKPMQLKELADVLLLQSRMNGDGRWLRDEQVAENLQELKELGLVGEATPPGHSPEYDVHPVVRGAAWELLTDPTRKRISGHILTEFWATPDRRSPSALDDLDRAIAHYTLLIQTGQLDRAWEMFVKWFWAAFFFRGDYRRLLNLFGLLLPGREVLQLLPLTSRRAQGEAAYVLGDLLAAAGEQRQASTLLRWCGTIRLHIGDLNGFLEAAHVRAWQMMYEGKLYETERTLRELKLQALAFGAYELRPCLDCWIGIIFALRGDKKGATACFEHARGQTVSNNWWVQGLAEGLVYLDEASEALDVLGRLQKGAGENEQPLEVAWQKLTEGMAFVGTGNFERAKLALSTAYGDARRSNYKIVQCFALPYLAEIALETGSLDEAEEWLSTYRDLDRDDEYALSAADAWRVQARCLLKRGGERALDCAQRAFQLAACDGPPFVYKSGLRRALHTLQAAKGYVPPTDATLDPQWKQELAAIQDDETRLGIASLQALSAGDASAPAEAQVGPEVDAIERKASPLDIEWWEAVTGSHPKIQGALLNEMSRRAITLQAFREAFERGPHKSLLVVFHRLSAERVIYPDQPRPVGEFGQTDIKRWLADSDAHQRALNAFLASEFAIQMRHPFQVHAFAKEDVAAFLKDHKRRIEFNAEPMAEEWWERLESSRPPLDMLVLAVCVLMMPAKLAEVVREISLGSDHGITYAFYSLRTRRAIDRHESTTISKTEGWAEVDVLLRLQDVKLQIGWQDASAEAKEFWDRLERENQHRLRQVLQLVEELRRRGVSMVDYHEAHLSTNTGNIQANLAYLDYLGHRKEPWRATGTWPTGAAAERWAYEGVRPSFTDAERLDPDQLASRIEFILNSLGRKELDRDQENWWKNLESVTSPQVRLRLAEELDFRRETLAGLRRAQVDGDTDNLVAAIAYLDYSLLNRGDEQKAEERAMEYNRVGNAHYEGNRFRHAAASYDRAIKEKPNPVYFTNLAGAWELVPDLDRIAALDHAIGSLRLGLEAFPDSQDLRGALKVAERKKRTAELGGFVPRERSHHFLPVVTPIVMEVAGNLAVLFEGAEVGNLASATLQRIDSMRDRIKGETGIKVPGIRVRPNDNFAPGTYVLMLDEVPLVSGNVKLDETLTLVAADKLSELGVPYTEAVNPIDGTPAFWVSLADAARLSDVSWDAIEYVLRHLDSLLRKNISLFAGMQEVINNLGESWSAASRQIASDQMLAERFTRMTKALRDECVPMNHIEIVCDVYLAAASKGMDELLGAVRALPEIRHRLPGNEAGAKLFELALDIERTIAQALVPLGDEYVLALTPEYTQEVLTAVRNAVSSPSDRPLRQAIVVREPRVRRYVRRLVELEFPQLFTLTAAEVMDETMHVKRTGIALQ
jgi:hypothetical protein